MMGCERCGHENQPGSKFCSQCAAPLAVLCSACGAEQPPGAKFCNQCASWELAGEPRVAMNRNDSEGLRKILADDFAMIGRQPLHVLAESVADDGSPVDPDHPIHAFINSFMAAWNDGDLSRARSFLHPELYAESYRTVVSLGTVRGEDARDAVIGFHHVCPRCHFEVIATAPFGHALQRWHLDGDDGPMEVVAVTRVQDGVITRAATFNADDLAGARVVFHDWSGDGSRAVRCIAAAEAAWNTGEIRELRSLLDPNLTQLSHRTVAARGDAHGDEAQSSIMSLPEFFPHCTFRLIETRGDDLALFRLELLSDDGSSLDINAVIEVGASGRIARAASFDADDVAEALALLTEWAFHEPSTGNADDDLVGNAAWSAAQKVGQAWRHRDRDDVLLVLADDFVLTSRGRLSMGATHDRESFADLVIHRATNPDGASNRQELVAIRGDDLCLFRVTETIDDYFITMVWLVHLAAGGIVELIRFDDDQIIAALDELDDRWEALGGPAVPIERARRLRHLWDSGTVEDLREFVSDGFVSVDHRPLGMGTRTRDEWIVTMADFVGRSIAVSPTILQATDRCLLARAHFWIRGDDALLVDGWAIFEYDRDGHLARMEMFALDQLTEARARFDEQAS